MDLDSFLVTLYVIVDDWWKATHPPQTRPGRPFELSPSEVLTLAILAQWPRWRCERDFVRFANRHLRNYFPRLLSQSQFNRRVRALEPELRALNEALAQVLKPLTRAIYYVLDTTLIPAINRVRACRHGLFAGQATFGRCVSKTEWVYGFKLGLIVSQDGIITRFGLAEARADERPIADALLGRVKHRATYLADKGHSGVMWERHWLEDYGALVIATPRRNERRAWDEGTYRWSAGKRQVVEQVVSHLKDLFSLERHRAHTLSGLLARIAARIVAYTIGLYINIFCLKRPMRRLADLLI